jgi:cytochrome c oxidase accessory protein FixG
VNTHLPVAKSSLRLDGKRNFVYPADVRGRFTTARNLLFVILIAIYVSLPWVKINHHPAVFIDVATRRFYLFGATFNAQDFWMMVFVLTGGAFALVYTTALLGRVWCGYACPQTVWLETVFRRVERWIEGPREKRMRRAEGPVTFDRVWRRIVLHAIWIVVALGMAHVFLSYFVSIPGLFSMMRHHPGEHPEAFLLVMVLSGILYFDFSWFREQFCVVLCPYGRLQSVLHDMDSLLVGYDAKRGEPRGKAKDKDRGECIDCGRCVNVCPTGIDIRNGLQMDCIACTQCIDACDEVMDRLGQKRGLIRYDSQHGLLGEPKRVIRSRIVIYTVLGLVGVAAATFAFSRRSNLEANILRWQGPPYVIESGQVRNMFRIHLFNKEGEATRFHIEPEPGQPMTFTVPQPSIDLDTLAGADVPLFVSMPEDDFKQPRDVRIVVRDDLGTSRVVVASFLGPAHHSHHGDHDHH